MGLMKLTGLDKVVKFMGMVKKLGGWMSVTEKRYILDDTKVGNFVGKDQFGNRYYENNDYFVPRNRWVEYPVGKWLEYDATQIPPEWFRWMHHMTDIPPTKKPIKKEKFALEHVENLSLITEEKYVPYKTTREKIQAWIPGQKTSGTTVH